MMTTVPPAKRSRRSNGNIFQMLKTPIYVVRTKFPGVYVVIKDDGGPRLSRTDLRLPSNL